MQNLLALFHEVTHRGLTVGRAVIKIGRTTIEVVVKVIFS